MMSMNKAILESVTMLNTHAGLGYKWAPGLDGCVGDVLYEDQVLLKGNPDDLTYCCGLTLQAYIMACTKIGKHIGTFADAMAIRRKWFIAEAIPGAPLYDNKGPVDALVPVGHGMEVELKDAIPGDLVQLWRKSGSGHSVIFINSFMENEIRALKYWSTQPSTKGIGYRTEYFDGVKNPIEHIHICRPI